MSETLLAAMMGVIATVWSIGFVAYNFIYNYFERRYLDEAFRMANGEIMDERRRDTMLGRISRNYWTVRRYRSAGYLAVLAIGTSGVVLAVAPDSACPVLAASATFAIALIYHLYLFTKELCTTEDQLSTLYRDIDRRRGGSSRSSVDRPTFRARFIYSGPPTGVVPHSKLRVPCVHPVNAVDAALPRTDHAY